MAAASAAKVKSGVQRGNALNNTTVGGAGSDGLDRGTGGDSLVGGRGNDVYVIDSTADIVLEVADAGSDTITTGFSSSSLASLPNVENLFIPEKRRLKARAMSS